jgi:hypothetical protein
MIRLRAEAPTFLQVAQQLAVDSDEAMVLADQHLSAIATFKKGVDTLFDPILTKSQRAVDAAKESHQQNKESKAELVKPADEADKILRDKILAQHKVRTAALERAKLADQAAATEKAADEQLEKAAKLERIGAVTGDDHYRQAAQQVLDQPVRPIIAPRAADKAPIKNAIVDHVSITVDDLSRLVIAVALTRIDQLKAGGMTDAQIADLRSGAVCSLRAIEADTTWLRKQAIQDGPAFNYPGVTRHVTSGLSVKAR